MSFSFRARPGPYEDPLGRQVNPLGGPPIGGGFNPAANPPADIPPSPFGDINYAPVTFYQITPEDGGGDGSSLYIIIGLIALAGIVLFMVLK